MSSRNVGSLLLLAVLIAMTVQADARGGASHGAAQEGASEPTVRGQVSLELLTPTEGADLNSYLHTVYATTKKNWFAKIPASVAGGQKGINVVEFRILQDGTVPKDFLKIAAGAGKPDLDEASLAGIRAAAPFAKLPEKFTGPFIELRCTFYYNLEPLKP
jgi:TonB-like protein